MAGMSPTKLVHMFVLVICTILMVVSIDMTEGLLQTGLIGILTVVIIYSGAQVMLVGRMSATQKSEKAQEEYRRVLRKGRRRGKPRQSSQTRYKGMLAELRRERE